MSVRKISELPYVDVRDESLAAQLNLSLLEISFSNYAQEDKGYWFTSKYVKYGEFVESIRTNIFNRPVHFYWPVYFHEEVYMYDGLNLCGNLFVNSGIDDSELANYQTIIRSNKNTFYALTENVLSSPTINAYTNNFNIRSFDGKQNIATFSTTDIRFHKPIGGDVHFNGNIVVDGSTKLNGNLTCTGDAYFTNDIHGCALCARWADLAEGYETD